MIGKLDSMLNLKMMHTNITAAYWYKIDFSTKIRINTEYGQPLFYNIRSKITKHNTCDQEKPMLTDKKKLVQKRKKLCGN